MNDNSPRTDLRDLVDLPRLPAGEVQAAIRWAREEVDRAMSALKSARDALEMADEGEL